MLCCSVASRTLLCFASPSRCRAGLRSRVILHFKALARQISKGHCLRHAMFRFAFARPCSSKQRLRSPYQSIAVACRGFASPLPCIALLCVAVPSLFAARPGRATQCLCASVRCRSFAEPSVSLLLLRRSPLRTAMPPPVAALPCSSFAMLCFPALIPRRSRLSRAFPSHPRADQSVSFAEPRSAFPSQPSA